MRFRSLTRALAGWLQSACAAWGKPTRWPLPAHREPRERKQIMGYEIKMFIGKTTSVLRPEREIDPDEPYSDGSVFAPKKDADGKEILTGREEVWFKIMAEIDLCKLGYQDDALNRLITQSHADAKADATHVHYVFGLDGNKEFKKDRYGHKMHPVPVRTVLRAMEESHPASPNEYRRTKWAKALLASMGNDGEELEVLFWGH